MTKKQLITLIVLLVIAGIVVVYRYQAGRTHTSVNSTTQSPEWKSYTDADDHYSFQYPPEFKQARGEDVIGVEFINPNVTSPESQQAFIDVEVLENPKGLSLKDWWDLQIKQGERADTTYQRVETDKTVGGKPAIVITPLDSGSTGYLFALGDKIISLHAYLVDSQIDKIVSTFKVSN